MHIPIYKPYLPNGSLKHAYDALASTWLSSQGKYIQIVQEKLQELLNVKYVLPVNNGTSACHLLSKILSHKHNKHKVIVPNNVYIAAINSFLFDSNFELYSIDADLSTWNIDLNQLDEAITLYPDAAVLIVHNIGNIINVPALQAKYPNTLFVEDNCEGFLGKYNNTYSGTTSLASAVSFFGNKNITSGEGGAFITNNEDDYLFAKTIHGQGQSDKRFIHNELGYNYRMTNIQAAILLGQLEILPQILEMKEEVFRVYREELKDREDVFIQTNQQDTSPANWMLGIRLLDNNYANTEIYFKGYGIEIRPMFYPISAHKHIRDNKLVHIDSCVNATTLNNECFILPSYPELTLHDQIHILTVLENYIKRKE